MTLKQTILIPIITALITLIFNFLFHILQDKINWFSDNKKFKREHSFQQLKNLYLNLYAIICQSEYLRYFLDIQGDYKDFPFIEMEKRKEIRRNVFDYNHIDFNNFTFNTTEYEIKDTITEFNKKKIYEEIIKLSEFSSQKLLKLAVAYRFVHDYYTVDDLESKEVLEKFQEQELNLIWNIIKTIVIETNEKLKLCNMDYNEAEIRSGKINIKM